jgi:hypothetical protein
MDQEVRRPFTDEELAIGRKPCVVEILDFLEQYRSNGVKAGKRISRSEELLMLRGCIRKDF